MKHLIKFVDFGYEDYIIGTIDNKVFENEIRDNYVDHPFHIQYSDQYGNKLTVASVVICSEHKLENMAEFKTKLVSFIINTLRCNVENKYLEFRFAVNGDMIGEHFRKCLLKKVCLHYRHAI